MISKDGCLPTVGASEDKNWMKIGKDFLFPDKDFIFYSSMCQSYHSICKVLIGTWQIILQVASHLLNMHKEEKSPGLGTNSISLVVTSCHTSKESTTMISTKDSKISFFQPDGIYIHQESSSLSKRFYHWLVQVEGADKWGRGLHTITSFALGNAKQFLHGWS